MPFISRFFTVQVFYYRWLKLSDNTERNFFFSKKEIEEHLENFGRSGQGKRSLINENSSDNSIGNENENGRFKEEKRLQAVKEAYWNNSDINTDFNPIYDALGEIFSIESPTEDQIKIAFMSLNAIVIGSVLMWDIDDTETRESVYEYLRDNFEDLKRNLGE